MLGIRIIVLIYSTLASKINALFSLSIVRLSWAAYAIRILALIGHRIEELVGLAFAAYTQFLGGVISSIGRTRNAIESVRIEDGSGRWADGNEIVFDTSVGLLVKSFIVVAFVAHVSVRVIVRVVSWTIYVARGRAAHTHTNCTVIGRPCRTLHAALSV